PAALLPRVLRWWWTPHIPVITAPWNAELVRAAFWTLRDVWVPTALAALAGGLLPLAALGGLREKGRAYLHRYGTPLALLAPVALRAGHNVPSREPVPLFGANFERILVYAVPLMVPLALIALDRIVPSLAAPTVSAPPRGQFLPALAALAVMAVPFLVLDRYR